MRGALGPDLNKQGAIVEATWWDPPASIAAAMKRNSHGRGSAREVREGPPPGAPLAPKLATTVWNAVVFADHGNSSYLTDLRRRAPGGPPGWTVMLKFLIGRKQAEFAQDDWLVGDVRVAPPRGPQEWFHVTVEARVLPTTSSPRP